MRSVGVRELKEQTSRILQEVHDTRQIVEITHRGRAIARLVPADRALSDAEKAKTAAVWADMDELAAEIAAHWPKGVTAEEAVREQRRDL